MMQQVGATTQALLRATSADTVRARVYTGKPARLLKTKWTQAWDDEDAPEPLPMPLQNLLVAEAHQRIMLCERPGRRLDARRSDRRTDERDPPGRRRSWRSFVQSSTRPSTACRRPARANARS